MAGVSFTTLLTAPGREPTGLQLVVAAHPDDEAQVWAAIEDDPATYTVVLTLTRGEATANCAHVPAVTNVDAGERLPRVVPDAPGTVSCGDARIDSWLFFLQRIGASTAEVALGRNPARREMQRDDMGGLAQVWSGDNAAHVALSLPDGGLTASTVRRAVEAVLDLRREVLPDLPLRRILGATYWNDSAHNGLRSTESGDCVTATDCPGSPDAFEYEHLDHRASAEALVALASSSQLGTWIAVPPGEPKRVAAALGVREAATWRVAELSVGQYRALMGIGPELEPSSHEPVRVGAVQVAYGWLSFPGLHWEVGLEPSATNGVLFPRRQTFLVAPGDRG